MVEISSKKSLEKRHLGFLKSPGLGTVQDQGLKEGDVLICTETSRLSRSLQEITAIIDDLLRKNPVAVA